MTSPNQVTWRAATGEELSLIGDELNADVTPTGGYLVADITPLTAAAVEASQAAIRATLKNGLGEDANHINFIKRDVDELAEKVRETIISALFAAEGPYGKIDDPETGANLIFKPAPPEL